MMDYNQQYNFYCVLSNNYDEYVDEVINLIFRRAHRFFQIALASQQVTVEKAIRNHLTA